MSPVATPQSVEVPNSRSRSDFCQFPIREKCVKRPQAALEERWNGKQYCARGAGRFATKGMKREGWGARDGKVLVPERGLEPPRP
jgi:hypothetical protein